MRRIAVSLSLLALWGCGGLKIPAIKVPTVTVTGTVLEIGLLEDKPLQGAWVVINGSRPASTDEKGTFTVRVPVPTEEEQSVEVNLSVSKHGYLTHTQKVRIFTGGETNLEPLYLNPAEGTGSLKGRVIEKPTGQGIPDAEVQLRLGAGLVLTVYTAADGTFLLTGIQEGEWGLQARAKGYLVVLNPQTGETRQSVTIRAVPPDENPFITLGLFPIGTPALIRGTVVNAETLLPVAEARVQIGEKEGTTDEDGKFQIPEAPTGTQTVIIRHDDFETFADTLKILGEPLFFFLNPPGSLPNLPFTLAGKVILEGETNHSGARVEAVKDGQVIEVAITDVRGDYAMWVPPGTYLVRARKEGFQGAEQHVTVRPGTPVIDVNFTLLRRP